MREGRGLISSHHDASMDIIIMQKPFAQRVALSCARPRNMQRTREAASALH